MLGAPIVTVTKNEILTALNKPEHFILALVVVAADGEQTDVRYLTQPFRATEDSLFAVTSVNYDWDELFARAAPPEPPARPPVEHWIEIMVERLKAQFSPERVILFGSRARGDINRHSDVDPLVVVDDERYDRGLAAAMRAALAGIPLSIDILVTTPNRIEEYGDLVGTVLRPALRDGLELYVAAERLPRP